MANNDSGMSFAMGMLVGGIVGTVVGLLIAPKPGAELRSDLTEQSQALRIRAEEIAAQMRERVRPAVETARERVGPAVEEVRERIAPAVDSVRERVTPLVEQARARAGRGAAGDDGAPTEEPRRRAVRLEPHARHITSTAAASARSAVDAVPARGSSAILRPMKRASGRTRTP